MDNHCIDNLIWIKEKIDSIFYEFGVEVDYSLDAASTSSGIHEMWANFTIGNVKSSISFDVAKKELVTGNEGSTVPIRPECVWREVAFALAIQKGKAS